MRVGLLSNLDSCGFSSTFFLLLNMEPLLKELSVFYYVNCMIFFGCLMFYFSNSFLIVSYNVILDLDSDANGKSCWSLLGPSIYYILFLF